MTEILDIQRVVDRLSAAKKEVVRALDSLQAFDDVSRPYRLFLPLVLRAETIVCKIYELENRMKNLK